MDKISGIYKIVNLINGKVYIGQSVDIKRRWYSERIGRCNNYLRNAFQKYGLENFTFEIIEECSKEVLNEKEIYYIALYDSTNHNKGYNLAKGGNSCNGYKCSEETIKKRAQANRGKKRSLETRKRLIDSHKNYSKETREKLSKAHKGKVDINHFRKVFCLELNQTFISIKEAAEITNTNRVSIIWCCKGERKTANGYHWQYI